MEAVRARGAAIAMRVLLGMGVIFGVLTLGGSLYYAFGMDSESKTLFQLAQVACFTTEGAESVERCAPLTRATVDGVALSFASPIGFLSWAAVLIIAGLAMWLLVGGRVSSDVRTRPIPRAAAWMLVACCGWLLISPLDKVWDEEYAEGLSTPATGVLSQYFPAVIGETSARVWLGSSDAVAAAVGRLVGQVFVVWVVALLVVAVTVLVVDEN